MRKLRFLIPLLVILVFVIGSVSAQQTYGYCGELSDEDCAILRNVETAQSGSVTGDIVVNVTLDEALYSVGVTMDGSYISNQEAIEMYKELSNMTPDEAFKAMYRDADTLLQFITNLFKIGDANLTLNVDMPPEITSGMVPNPLTVDLWMVDGVGYTDLSTFSFADPTLEGIWGVDFVGLYTGIFEIVFSDPEIEQIFSETFSDTSAMGGFSDTSVYAEFITLKRLSDETIDGQAMAVFETTFDYGAFFDSTIMRDLLNAQIEMQSTLIQNMDPDMSEEEITMMEDTLIAVMDAYALIFDDTTLTSTYKIGVDDNYIHETEVIYQMDVDTAAAAEAFNEAISIGDEGGLPEDMEIPAVFKLDILMTSQSTDFGTIETIPLPDSAQIVPDELLGMIMDADA